MGITKVTKLTVNTAWKAGIAPFLVELAGHHYFGYGASPIWEMRIFRVQRYLRSSPVAPIGKDSQGSKKSRMHRRPLQARRREKRKKANMGR
jgi:hypothetical protein